MMVRGKGFPVSDKLCPEIEKLLQDYFNDPAFRERSSDEYFAIYASKTLKAELDRWKTEAR
jgi:hypothetical protein